MGCTNVKELSELIHEYAKRFEVKGRTPCDHATNPNIAEAKVCRAINDAYTPGYIDDTELNILFGNTRLPDDIRAPIKGRLHVLFKESTASCLTDWFGCKTDKQSLLDFLTNLAADVDYLKRLPLGILQYIKSYLQNFIVRADDTSKPTLEKLELALNKAIDEKTKESGQPVERHESSKVSYNVVRVPALDPTTNYWRENWTGGVNSFTFGRGPLGLDAHNMTFATDAQLETYLKRKNGESCRKKQDSNKCLRWKMTGSRGRIFRESLLRIKPYLPYLESLLLSHNGNPDERPVLAAMIATAFVESHVQQGMKSSAEAVGFFQQLERAAVKDGRLMIDDELGIDERNNLVYGAEGMVLITQRNFDYILNYDTRSEAEKKKKKRPSPHDLLGYKLGLVNGKNQQWLRFFGLSYYNSANNYCAALTFAYNELLKTGKKPTARDVAVFTHTKPVMYRHFRKDSLDYAPQVMVLANELSREPKPAIPHTEELVSVEIGKLERSINPNIIRDFALMGKTTVEIKGKEEERDNFFSINGQFAEDKRGSAIAAGKRVRFLVPRSQLGRVLAELKDGDYPYVTDNSLVIRDLMHLPKSQPHTTLAASGSDEKSPLIKSASK